MLYIVQPGFGILLNVLNEFEKHVFGENMQKEIIKNIHFSKYLSNYIFKTIWMNIRFSWGHKGRIRGKKMACRYI